MSSEDQDPLDQRLQAWIDEAEDASAKGTPWSSAKEAELLALFEVAGRELPPEMPEGDAAALLNAVQAACQRQSGPASLKAALLGVAAVLFGLALGVTTLAGFSPRSSPNPRTDSVEIIKQVYFESIHEGRVVQFQLELSRVR